LDKWYISPPLPDSLPLIGGPGCSGLVGFFTEFGPWRPVHDDLDQIALVSNPYAWNKHANMVFLEQPVGTGFSYWHINTNLGEPAQQEWIGDDVSAIDFLNAIVEFYQRFPERKSNPLYFASESYGGHYIPELTLQLYQSSYTKIKDQLQGLLIGNPYVSFGTGFLSRGHAFWNFQLIPRSLWLRYQSNSCDNMDLTFEEFSEACWDLYSEMFEKASPHLDYCESSLPLFPLSLSSISFDTDGANFPVCNATSTLIDSNPLSPSWMTPLSEMRSGQPLTPPFPLLPLFSKNLRVQEPFNEKSTFYKRSSEDNVACKETTPSSDSSEGITASSSD
jgi:hypothetical protein